MKELTVEIRRKQGSGTLDPGRKPCRWKMVLYCRCGGISGYDGRERRWGIDDVLWGSNEVFAVKTSDGQEILIPSIKDCVIAMDLTKKIVTVHLLEGLR
ncbi:MAG: hypothetical protein ACLTXL_09350 [Clostridia bacterium]